MVPKPPRGEAGKDLGEFQPVGPLHFYLRRLLTLLKWRKSIRPKMKFAPAKSIILLKSVIEES